MQKPYNGQKANDTKKKDKGSYKGINKLSPLELLEYCKDNNKCLHCGEK